MKKTHILVFLVVFFIFLKISGFFYYDVIAKDGVTYATLAEGFHKSGLKEALNITFPPLYPVITGLLAYIIEPIFQLFPIIGKYFDFYEFCGIFSSTLFFIVLVFSVYFIGKKFYGDRVALWASVITCTHPLLFRYSSEVLTETLFTLLLFWGIYGLITASQRKSYILSFLSAFSFGLSYYVKPESIAIALLLLILVNIFDKEYRNRFFNTVIFVSVILLTITPYVIYLYNETGELMLSNKQNIVFYLSVKRTFPEMKDLEPIGVISFTMQHPFFALRKLIYGLKETIWHLPEAFFRPYFILLLLFFFSKKQKDSLRVIVLWLIATYFIIISFYNLDRRYYIPFFPLISFYVARGFFIFDDWLSKKLHRKVSSYIVALIFMIAAVKAVPRYDNTNGSIKKIAMGLQLGKSKIKIASNDIRYSFYPRGEHIPLEDFLIRSVHENACAADILILNRKEDHDTIKKMNQLLFIYKNMPHSNRLKVNGEDFIIYSKENIEIKVVN
ncbi:MAG: glycosyltransferase family 39 protein [Candidatus Aureabacteria bacterium]|nr:glycosyltransferase family 39 protein [Candidatus Auribacterota bacterium]